MDRLVSIDVYLIVEITWFPIDGENIEQYLNEKTKKKSLPEEMKKTYDIERGFRGIIINIINEPAMILATKLMACKILMKCHKEEAPA